MTIDVREIDRAAELLERAGLQRTRDWVNLDTPAGVYYLRADDCDVDQTCIQVLWVDVPNEGLGRITAGQLAKLLGWTIVDGPSQLDQCIPDLDTRTYVGTVMEKRVVH